MGNNSLEIFQGKSSIFHSAANQTHLIEIRNIYQMIILMKYFQTERKRNVLTEKEFLHISPKFAPRAGCGGKVARLTTVKSENIPETKQN